MFIVLTVPASQRPSPVFAPDELAPVLESTEEGWVQPLSVLDQPPQLTLFTAPDELPRLPWMDEVAWQPPVSWDVPPLAVPVWGGEETPTLQQGQDEGVWAPPAPWTPPTFPLLATESEDLGRLPWMDEDPYRAPPPWLTIFLPIPWADSDELSPVADDDPGWRTSPPWEALAFLLRLPFDLDQLPIGLDDEVWTPPAPWGVPLLPFLATDPDDLPRLPWMDEPAWMPPSPWPPTSVAPLLATDEWVPQPGVFFLHDDPWASPPPWPIPPAPLPATTSEDLGRLPWMDEVAWQSPLPWPIPSTQAFLVTDEWVPTPAVFALHEDLWIAPPPWPVPRIGLPPLDEGAFIPPGVDFTHNLGYLFTAATSVTIPGSLHGLGHSLLRVQVYDAGTPRQRLPLASVHIAPSTFDITVEFLQPQSGLIVVNGAAPTPPTTLSNQRYAFSTPATTWTILGTTHGFGTDRLLIDVYDASTPASWQPLADVSIHPSTFDITITWLSVQTGSVIVSAAAAVGIPNLGFSLTSNPQTITGATHGLGTANIGPQVYDTAGRQLVPGDLTVDPSTYDVVVSFAQTQTGTLVLNGPGAQFFLHDDPWVPPRPWIPTTASAVLATDERVPPAVVFGLHDDPWSAPAPWPIPPAPVAATISEDLARLPWMDEVAWAPPSPWPAMTASPLLATDEWVPQPGVFFLYEDPWISPAPWPIPAAPLPAILSEDLHRLPWLEEEAWHAPVLWPADASILLPLDTEQIPIGLDEDAWQPPQPWLLDRAVSFAPSPDDLLLLPWLDEMLWGPPVPWAATTASPAVATDEWMPVPGVFFLHEDPWVPPAPWPVPPGPIPATTSEDLGWLPWMDEVLWTPPGPWVPTTAVAALATDEWTPPAGMFGLHDDPWTSPAPWPIPPAPLAATTSEDLGWLPWMEVDVWIPPRPWVVPDYRLTVFAEAEDFTWLPWMDEVFWSPPLVWPMTTAAAVQVTDEWVPQPGIFAVDEISWAIPTPWPLLPISAPAMVADTLEPLPTAIEDEPGVLPFQAWAPPDYRATAFTDGEAMVWLPWMDEVFALPPPPWPPTTAVPVLATDEWIPQPIPFDLYEDAWIPPAPWPIPPAPIAGTTSEDLAWFPWMDEVLWTPPLPWPPTTAMAALATDEWVPPAPIFQRHEDTWAPPAPWPVPAPIVPALMSEDLAYAPWLHDETWLPPAPWEVPAPGPVPSTPDELALLLWPEEVAWAPPSPWLVPPTVPQVWAQEESVPFAAITEDAWSPSVTWEAITLPVRLEESEILPTVVVAVAVEDELFTVPRPWPELRQVWVAQETDAVLPPPLPLAADEEPPWSAPPPVLDWRAAWERIPDEWVAPAPGDETGWRPPAPWPPPQVPVVWRDTATDIVAMWAFVIPRTIHAGPARLSPTSTGHGTLRRTSPGSGGTLQRDSDAGNPMIEQ